MPKRKRHRAGGATAPPEESEADQAVRLFAQRQRDEVEARRVAKRAAKAARTAQEHRDSLVRAKDEAADELKRVRKAGRGGEAIAAAEADYRAALDAALDAVLADEAGPGEPANDAEATGSVPDGEASEPAEADPEPKAAGGTEEPSAAE